MENKTLPNQPGTNTRTTYRLYHYCKSKNRWLSTNHFAYSPDYQWGGSIGQRIANGTAVVVKETTTYDLPPIPQ